jgi:membrane protein required for colicin V production
MDAAFSAFDLFAVAVLFLSGLMALMRGFVREALTVTAFVAAALAALWTRPVFASILEGPVGGPLTANAIAMVTVFLLVYLAVSFITNSLSKNVKRGEDVPTLDRTLGFMFGVARGLVLLGLMVLVFTSAAGGAAPAWMRSAQVYPLAQATANLLQHLAPAGSPIDPDTAQNPGEDIDDDPIGRLIEQRTAEDDEG